MKVVFTYKDGRTREIPQKHAELLSKAKMGYMTRHLTPLSDVDLEFKPLQSDGLDDLDKDALHELAKEKGLKLHHALGAEKVRAAIREMQQ